MILVDAVNRQPVDVPADGQLRWGTTDPSRLEHGAVPWSAVRERPSAGADAVLGYLRAHPAECVVVRDGLGEAVGRAVETAPDSVVIRYAVEDIDRGWAVWRQVEGGPLTHVGAREYGSRAMADQAVTAACQADRAAATRLGVTVRHERS